MTIEHTGLFDDLSVKDFAQDAYGSCQTLAVINALLQSQEGRDHLESLVTQKEGRGGMGDYIVSFPGREGETHILPLDGPSNTHSGMYVQLLEQQAAGNALLTLGTHSDERGDTAKYTFTKENGTAASF